jgi:hypothetical protein
MDMTEILNALGRTITEHLHRMNQVLPCVDSLRLELGAICGAFNMATHLIRALPMPRFSGQTGVRQYVAARMTVVLDAVFSHETELEEGCF